jgi:hypothetical protein
MRNFLVKVRRKIKVMNNRKYKNKFFVIGLNKTGTTSMAKAFRDFKYKVDDQNQAHKLMYFYERRNFKSIVKYCKRSEVFQDTPFSLKYTYYFLHQAFPNAKFILTIRDSPEEWYSSLLNFHKEKYSSSVNAPSKEDLEKAKRPHGRSVYDNIKMRFNTPDNDLYNKEIMIKYYVDHNKDVIDYFRPIAKNFLILNVKEPQAYQQLCAFIGKKPLYKEFPWENKTENITKKS